MMDQLAEDILRVWNSVGLPLKPRIRNNGCPQGGEHCTFCRKPMLFEKHEARFKEQCNIPNCPQLVLAH